MQNDSDSSSSGQQTFQPKDISEVVKKLERAGPGSDRLSAMRAAFKSQYNTQVIFELNLIKQ